VSVGRFAYFAVAIVLCAFGTLAILSIGAPFFLSGAAMLAVSPWRGRRDVVWPVITAPAVFTAIYVAIAPISCTTTGSSGPLLARTTCSSTLGIDYSGAGVYEPPLLPALLAGLVGGALVALALHRLLAGPRVDG
jgi:hypothetical protein